MQTDIIVLHFFASMRLLCIFHCAPAPVTSVAPTTEFIEELNEKSSTANERIMLEIDSDPTTSSPIAKNTNSSESTSANVLSLFNSSPKDVIELILRDGNRTAEMPSSTDSNTKDVKGALEINLDETRDELFRALQYEASVQIDALSHERIRTISEERLRTTLEQILDRQFGEAKHKPAMNNMTDVESTTTSTHNTTSSDAVTLSSQLICQFFVFGTLFGVVCSISTCTCCLHPRSNRRRNGELNGVNPTNVPAPIDYSKPYMLKCDSRGSCYASPLNDDEVPPLPSYTEALSCATQPAPKPQSASNNTNAA